MLEGPSFEVYKDLLKHTQKTQTQITDSGVMDETITGIHLVASGGISGVGDLEALDALGCEGAILG